MINGQNIWAVIQILQSALQKLLYFITNQGTTNSTSGKYQYTPTKMSKIDNRRYSEDLEKLKLSYEEKKRKKLSYE